MVEQPHRIDPKFQVEVGEDYSLHSGKEEVQKWSEVENGILVATSQSDFVLENNLIINVI